MAAKTKTIDFKLECKADKAKNTIEGYASVANVLDLQDEMIALGAYAKTIQAKPDGVPFLWQHWPDSIIGKTIHLAEDSHGLEFEALLSTKTQLAIDAFNLADEKFIDGISVGINPVTHTWVEPPAGSGLKSYRLLSEVDLWEISLVTFPANIHARVQQVNKLWLPEYMRHLKATTEGHGIAHVINTALDEASGNRAELELAMQAEAGIKPDDLRAILSGEVTCPTEAIVKGLARGLGIAEQMLLDAGNSVGCKYPDDGGKAAPIEVIEVKGDRLVKMTLTEAELAAIAAECQAFKSVMSTFQNTEHQAAIPSGISQETRQIKASIQELTTWLTTQAKGD